MTSTLPCSLNHTANALPLYIFVINLKQIIGFTTIRRHPAGLPGFQLSLFVPRAMCLGFLDVFVSTETSAFIQ